MIELFRQEVPLIGLLAVMSFAATGMFALPRAMSAAADRPGWSEIFTVLSGIDGELKLLSPSLDHTALIAAIALQIVLIAFAILRRSCVATTLAIAPTTLVLLLWAADQQWTAIQLVSIPIACAYCAAAYLWDEAAMQPRSEAHNFKSLAAAAFCLLLALTVPRMFQILQAVARYVLWPELRYQYSSVEFDRLAQAIGQKTVEIDLSDINPLLPLFLEFGRRGINMRWTSASWTRLFSYRKWPTPGYSTEPDFRITSSYFGPTIDGTPVLSTTHYKIFTGTTP
ncbi:MAG: hypothetical protein ACLP8A_05295 [Methylovirgula sp.]